MEHASDCALHNAPALPRGPCDCWEYEYIDPLTGCATCGRCGARRYLSSEQMKEIQRLQAEYDEAMERDNT